MNRPTNPDALGRVAWFFPAALALHNLEESIWMPRFWQVHQLHTLFTPLGFRIAAAALVVLAIGVTALAQNHARHSVPAKLFFIYCAAMWLNAIWHIGVSIYFRGYAPGVVTAVLVVLPVTTYLLLWNWRMAVSQRDASSASA